MNICSNSAPIVVVGLQVVVSTVNESIGDKFTCVEIISGGPLLSDADILFYTQDGTAKGKATSEHR